MLFTPICFHVEAQKKYSIHRLLPARDRIQNRSERGVFQNLEMPLQRLLILQMWVDPGY